MIVAYLRLAMDELSLSKFCTYRFFFHIFMMIMFTQFIIVLLA